MAASGLTGSTSGSSHIVAVVNFALALFAQLEDFNARKQSIIRAKFPNPPPSFFSSSSFNPPEHDDELFPFSTIQFAFF
jgi:hypothetical protein